MHDDRLNDNLENNEKEDILKNIDTSMFSSEQLEQQENIVEAILFMMGDSVSVDVLATALSKDHDIALAAVERLVNKYNTVYCDRGMKVIRINHKYQMVANNQYFQNLVLVASKPQKPVLTDAVLETLSIIAYKQPITKPEIENIRGVKSDFAVNRLIEYGLIEEKGRLDAPGRPIVLGTTEEFLLRFGLESTDDLPILPITREEEIKDEVAKELQKAFGEHVDVNEALNNNENKEEVIDDKELNDKVNNNVNDDKDNIEPSNDDINNITNNIDKQNEQEIKDEVINQDYIDDKNNVEDYKKLNNDNFLDNENYENNSDTQYVEKNIHDEYDKIKESNDVLENTYGEDTKFSDNFRKDNDSSNENNDIFKQEEIEDNEEIDIVDYENNNDLNNLYDKNLNDNYENKNITNQQFDTHIDTQKDEKIDGDDKEPQ